MSSLGAYAPSPTKGARMSKADIEALQDCLFAIVDEQKPMTVRQVFYQATVHNLVEKTEAGYRQVQRALATMRREGNLPWDWIADNTRSSRRPTTFSGPADAADVIVQVYRKSLWLTSDRQVQVWLEKDALSGVVYPVTAELDVPLMVARGYASLSFLHDAAEQLNEVGKPAYVYHLGDFDPSGQDAADKIEESLRDYATDVDVFFEKLAVTPTQIADWSLPTRPTKSSDSRAKNFGSVSVELDAIDPRRLRGLVKEAIERHMPANELQSLRIAERSERKQIADWAREMREGQEGWQ